MLLKSDKCYFAVDDSHVQTLALTASLYLSLCLLACLPSSLVAFIDFHKFAFTVNLIDDKKVCERERRKKFKEHGTNIK